MIIDLVLLYAANTGFIKLVLLPVIDFDRQVVSFAFDLTVTSWTTCCVRNDMRFHNVLSMILFIQ